MAATGRTMYSGQLQQQPLLRVHGPRLTRRDAEERRTSAGHWNGIESPERQVQPASVTVVAPSDTDPRGVPSDPHITLPWNQGALDDSAQAHELIVGPVTAA